MNSSPRAVSLIATVFNEGGELHPWLAALAAQTRAPGEIVICDGGSSDGTLEHLSRWAAEHPGLRVRVIQKPGSNIAAGRNAAIEAAAGPVIAVTDAGAPPRPGYLAEMLRPFEADPAAQAVAGHFRYQARTPFQRALAAYLGKPWERPGFLPSSRAVAFTKDAWQRAGGYPEWMTQAAEDTLFNQNLLAQGIRFKQAPAAIVDWNLRPDLSSFLRMAARNAFGDAETGSARGTFLRTVAKLVLKAGAVSAAGLLLGRHCGWAFGILGAVVVLCLGLSAQTLSRRAPVLSWPYFWMLSLLGGAAYLHGYAKGALFGKTRPKP